MKNTSLEDGVYRALTYLTTSDGKSLLEQVKALSTVSGGTWFGGAFSYLNDPVISDDDFLNQYVEDRSKYVVTDPTNKLPENLVLDKLPEGNFGKCISSDFAYFPNLIASMFQMYQQNATPLGSTYQTFVGQLILEKFGLYSGGDTEPDSTFSYDEQTKKEILERNPGLANKTVHLYPVPEAGKRLRRPFWISNFSMLTNSVAPDHPVRLVIPVQSTPFYTGVFSSPPGLVDNNKQPIGGGGVETFAFNSQPSSFKQDTDTVYQHRLFSIADSIGASSSFYAYFLMGQNQFSPTPKDSQGWKNTVGGILGMIDQLNLEDIFQSIIAVSNQKTVKAGSSIPTEHNLDELAAMAVDMLNITGLTEKLNKLGIKDINEVITAAFNYFQVKFPNLNLMDGLMDAGVASFILLMITSLIDNVTQRAGDQSASVINSFNNLFKSCPLLQTIKKDIKNFETIAKDIKTIVKDFEIIPKYIDAAANEVVPMLHELVPRYYYWSKHNAQSQQNWAFQPDEFCDGGILENYGIANMLTYTDIDNIICFINSSPIILNAGYFDPQIQGDAIITGIEIDRGIPPLFGYHTYNAEIRGYVQYKEGDTSDILNKNNQVFPKSKFYEVLTGLIKASGRNCRQKSTNFKQALTTVDNALFGVKGGRKVNVLWSYLNYAQDWAAGLNEEVQEQVRNIKDFPNYTICFMQYNNREINLMSGQAAWNVAGNKNKDLFISMFES
ncbi:hypothetical protein [Desulfobacter vibrioformis]|uniref:hypothetical protein n=1 Tax=Desulfobacter vibrioformis TaxID=34031 RepID=UPI000AFD9B34|nr:hypothetical protein [Desulfobacter vibrioformis]